MDVNGLLEGERLEVGPPVVHVDDGVKICPVVEGHEVFVSRDEEHPQGSSAAQGIERVDLADDDDGRHVLACLEYREPLGELVELRDAIGEVQGNLGAWYVVEVKAIGSNLGEFAHAAHEAPGHALGEGPHPGRRRHRLGL